MRRRRMVFAAVLGLSGLLLSGCDMPKDQRNSLENARAEGLRVGVIEASPWVRWNGGEPAGPEAEIVRRLAAEIGASIRWTRGSSEALMETLRGGDLHIVIGGLSSANPWRKHVALTRPHTECTARVGIPSAMPPLSLDADDLEGLPVAVPFGTPLAGWVREKGGTPVPVLDIAGVDSIAAEVEYVLREKGFTLLDTELKKLKYVLAVPKGENALLARLEKAFPDSRECTPLRSRQRAAT